MSQQPENKWLELTPKPAAPTYRPYRPNSCLKLWVPIEPPVVYFWPYPYKRKQSPEERATLEKIDKRGESQQFKLDVMRSIKTFEDSLAEFERRNAKNGYCAVNWVDRLTYKPIPHLTSRLGNLVEARVAL